MTLTTTHDRHGLPTPAPASPPLTALSTPASASGAPEPPRLRDAARRPALTVVEGGLETTHWFCGYCGVSGPAQPPPPIARVCGHCRSGLLLEAPADAAPRPDEPFLVVDRRLTVQAVSRRAETLLGVVESDLIDHPVTELITDADAEGDERGGLVAALTDVAESGEGRQSTFVRPRDQFGIRIQARISHCGPPRAALIVLEAPSPGSGPRLRLVPAQQDRAAHQET